MARAVVKQQQHPASNNKRSWPQRIQFWRSASRIDEEEEEDEEDELDTAHDSPSSSSSESSYSQSYVTGDGISYADTNDETKTFDEYYDDDDEDDDDDITEATDDADIALQEFVGGVLSSANRSFRSFMTGGGQTQQQDSILGGYKEEEEEMTYQQFDDSYSAVIRDAPSFGTDRSSKITTTTSVEERLSQNVKLLHEVHEEASDEETHIAPSAGCTVFPFEFRKPLQENRSFASTTEESTFLQLQEKLRETRLEKQSLDSATFDIHSEEKTEDGDVPLPTSNLMRRLADNTDHVLDTIGLFGCVPRKPTFQKHTTEEEEEEDTTFAAASTNYDTATDYEDTTYAGYETNPDAQTYDGYYDESHMESSGASSTNVYSTRVGTVEHHEESSSPKFSLRQSLQRLYNPATTTTTDESSIGSDMDQSHIYLMMTTARRQRTLQERKKNKVVPHHRNVDSYHLMSLTRPPPNHHPNEYHYHHPTNKKSFFEVPFVQDFVVKQQQQDSDAALLKLQATRAIQERWLREFQMAMHEPPDAHRQFMAKRVLSAWKNRRS